MAIATGTSMVTNTGTAARTIIVTDNGIAVIITPGQG